jgi:hypothetical protein
MKAADWSDRPAASMASDNHWSITLASARIRRPRWLAENGRFSSDPSRALRLISPEVAVRRVQAYMKIHGWSPEVMERFRLVPAPHPSAESAADSDRLVA